LSKTLPIVRVNEVPNGTDMLRQFLGEREGFPHQTTAPLTNRVIQPFNQAGLPAGFIHGFVPFRG
jgi:hypothetical protein